MALAMAIPTTTVSSFTSFPTSPSTVRIISALFNRSFLFTAKHGYGDKHFSRARLAFNWPGGYSPISVQAMDASSSSFGSSIEESVKETVTEYPVVVYSKSWCPYSSEVKSLFKQLGVQPLVIELDELGPQGPQTQMVLERLTGQTTVPNVFIGGKHIGGCSDTVKLHHKGELEPLLLEANAKPTQS